jgi:hypothetical protein
MSEPDVMEIARNMAQSPDNWPPMRVKQVAEALLAARSEHQSAGRDSVLEAADEIAAQLAELVECAERDLKMNRDEEPGGHWSLRTANCFLPARYALATYRSLKQEGGA